METGVRNSSEETQQLLNTESTNEPDNAFRIKSWIPLIAIFATMLLILLIYCWLPTASQNLLILISLDGTRPEYLRRNLTPTLSRLANHGSMFEMKPSFPTITFPNHYTLVTGLHPAEHGIVGNTFYDPVKNDTFVYTNPAHNRDPSWWIAEPIWTTAIKQSIICGTLFWPGSEHEHDGILPNYWLQFNNSMRIQEKVNLILEWTTMKSSPRFITMYIPDIDHAGHEYGPNSEYTNLALKRVDDGIKKLLKGLKSQGLEDSTDIVIVSDHGMTGQSRDKVVLLNQIINTNETFLYFNGGMVMIEPKSIQDLDSIYTKLKAQANGRYKVWFKDTIPEEYHYSSPRVCSIILQALDNYAILENMDGWIGQGI